MQYNFILSNFFSSWLTHFSVCRDVLPVFQVLSATKMHGSWLLFVNIFNIGLFWKTCSRAKSCRSQSYKQQNQKLDKKCLKSALKCCPLPSVSSKAKSLFEIMWMFRNGKELRTLTQPRQRVVCLRIRVCACVPRPRHPMTCESSRLSATARLRLGHFLATISLFSASDGHSFFVLAPWYCYQPQHGRWLETSNGSTVT